MSGCAASQLVVSLLSSIRKMLSTYIAVVPTIEESLLLHGRALT